MTQGFDPRRRSVHVIDWREIAWDGAEARPLSTLSRPDNQATKPGSLFTDFALESLFDPGRPGPYSTCVSKPTIFYQDPEGKSIRVLAYAPGVALSPNRCQALVRNCPLILLFHAHPAVECSPIEGAEYYKEYHDMGVHLASHGYVLLSVQWGAYQSLAMNDSLIKKLLDWISNGGLGLKDIISNNLAFIGHSRGGKLAQIALNGALSKGWNVQALIVMSPQFDEGTPPEENASAGAFLGIQVFDDCDGSTNGSKMVEGRPASAVWSFEIAGHGPAGTSSTLSPPSIPKHLIYVDNGKSSCGHFYQQAKFVRAYVCAFLMGYVRGDAQTRHIYFRGQGAIPGMESLFLRHMHAEPAEVMLVDWAKAPMRKEDNCSSSVVDLFEANPDSMLSTGVALAVTFIRGSGAAIGIFLVPYPLVGYTHISIGICQRGTPLGGGGKISPKVTFSGIGGIKPFDVPVVLNQPTTHCFVQPPSDAKRTCMTECSFSLLEIAKAGIDLCAGIEAIFLDFSDAESAGEEAVVFIGPIKAIGAVP